jgi:hypothetical protein
MLLLDTKSRYSGDNGSFHGNTQQEEEITEHENTCRRRGRARQFLGTRCFFVNSEGH